MCQEEKEAYSLRCETIPPNRLRIREHSLLVSARRTTTIKRQTTTMHGKLGSSGWAAPAPHAPNVNNRLDNGNIYISTTRHRAARVRRLRTRIACLSLLFQTKKKCLFDFMVQSVGAHNNCSHELSSFCTRRLIQCNGWLPGWLVGVKSNAIEANKLLYITYTRQTSD